MTTHEVRSICTHRLDAWKRRLISEHATPAILIGIGHDHVSGQWVLCATEDGLTDEQIIMALRGMADMLERGENVERR